MWRSIGYFVTGALTAVFLSVLTSCSHDAEMEDLSLAEEMTLSVGFRLPTRVADDRYEEGNTYENYIDVPNGNYRLYFFDAEDKFITRFEPRGFVMTEGSNYRQYNVLGKAPDALASCETFKLVVLANWPTYADADMKVGETTIEDICNADSATFGLTDHFLGSEAKKLIPFYGVHEYRNITFTAGQATVLTQPVTLLRAVAKVEVIVEMDSDIDLSLTSLRINRYNAKGYCAPKDVFRQEDYDHEGSWDEDYVHTLHLVDDKNDEDAKYLVPELVSSWKDGKKVYEKWATYLPEYRNKGVGDACSSIEAKFNIQLDNDLPHTIYFADYDDGKVDNSNDDNRLNIERNNIYRFHVKCTSYNFKLQLTVSNWEGLYENDFEYGDGQFTTPPAPWEDEINNNVEF